MTRPARLFAFVLAWTVLAATTIGADLVGSWNVADPKRPMKAGRKFTMKFVKGGKATMNVYSPPINLVVDATYTLVGDKLTLKMVSQTVNGKKQKPPQQDPAQFKIQWKNKDTVLMTDLKEKGAAPAVLRRIK